MLGMDMAQLDDRAGVDLGEAHCRRGTSSTTNVYPLRNRSALQQSLRSQDSLYHFWKPIGSDYGHARRSPVTWGRGAKTRRAGHLSAHGLRHFHGG
jgi:hypothetical protein